MSSVGDSSSGGAASPLTARSIRLERVAQALAHSQEELRRYGYNLFILFITIFYPIKFHLAVDIRTYLFGDFRQCQNLAFIFFH